MVATVTERSLGLGEWAVTTDPRAVLICLGLGSCVAFAAFDPSVPVAGMAHMVLPDSSAGRVSEVTPAKFVDLAVPLVLQAMVRQGARPEQVRVHLVGGASMLTNVARVSSMNIGERNAEAARTAVRAHGLRIAGEHLGGTHGRTVRLAIDTGEVSVTTAGTKE